MRNSSHKHLTLYLYICIIIKKNQLRYRILLYNGRGIKNILKKYTLPGVIVLGLYILQSLWINKCFREWVGVRKYMYLDKSCYFENR